MKMTDGVSEFKVFDYEVIAKELAPLSPELDPNNPDGKFIALGAISFGFDAEEKLKSVQINHGEGLGFSNLFRRRLKKRRTV